MTEGLDVLRAALLARTRIALANLDAVAVGALGFPVILAGAGWEPSLCCQKGLMHV